MECEDKTMIALITGATGDIGREFVKEILDEVDQIWAVGRSEERLVELVKEFGQKIVPIKSDLSKEAEIQSLCERIEREKPEIQYLINNAGVAKMGEFSEFSHDEVATMLNINCEAAALLCRVSIPFMKKGSFILNIASASAFQPNPYISLYAASKAYLLSFTRAINRELRDITCTAVCPGWVDTKMLPKEKDGKRIRYLGIVTPEKVVKQALKDCHKGKDVSMSSSLFKYTRFYSKVIPHRFIMNQWLKMIKKYL